MLVPSSQIHTRTSPITAKRSILESTGRWSFSSVAVIGTKNTIAMKAARTHGSGRLVCGKASRGAGAASSIVACCSFSDGAPGRPATATSVMALT